MSHPDPITSEPYDPIEHDAKCDKCPLQGKVVVPPEIRSGKPIIVAMEPGETEIEEGAPLIGASGKEMMRAIRAVGLTRADFSYTNARLCAHAYAAQRPAQDRAAYEACLPRLKRELAEAPFIIAFGAVALNAITNAAENVLGIGGRGEAGLSASRGFPFEIDIAPYAPRAEGEAPIRRIKIVKDGESKPSIETRRVPCLATYHPAALFRSRGLTRFFRADVAKAARLIRGASTWTEPEYILDPTSDTLRNVLAELAASGDITIVDIETRRGFGGPDKADPLTAVLRCIGFGDWNRAVIAHFESCEEPRKHFRCDPSTAREIINNFFADERVRIGGHNFIAFDWPICKRTGICPPPISKIIDTMLLAHVADPQAPASLSFWVSYLTDAPAWKPMDHDSWVNDDELAIYCLSDVVRNRRIATKLAEMCRDRKQGDIYKSDRRFQEICNGMGEAGLFINERERLRHYDRLTKKRDEAQARAFAAIPLGVCFDKANGSPICLASPDQVRRFLFDYEHLPHPSHETKSGKPSTGADAINELLSIRLPTRVVNFLEALQDYRRAAKWRETFVEGFAPCADGRVHSSIRAIGTNVGRPASSGPNVFNLPGQKHDTDSLRSMIEAAPGNKLVYADMDQFHLRLIAPIANDAIWLECFAAKDKLARDPHRVNAARYGQKRLEDVDKEEREFWKTNVYALVYLATPETFLAAMKRVKNKEGRRPYADWTLDMATDVYDGFFRDHPGIQEWWDRDIQEFKRLGYVVDLVLGRRCDFEDAKGKGDDGMRDVINYRILATEGGLMGGHGATGRLVDRVPFGLYGPGLILHTYDALLIEVNEQHEAMAKEALMESMTTTFMGVPLTTSAKSGTNLAALE